MKFSKVSSDDRRTIFANDELLDDKAEISIIELKKGKAIGGCMHKKIEYYAILSGCVVISKGVENTVGIAPDSGMFEPNTPHAFFAEDDAVIMEWGIPFDEKGNEKDEEMLKKINDYNEITHSDKN